MTNKIKEHEDINLHIKKKTFFTILYSLIFYPIAFYFIASMAIVIDFLPDEKFYWWVIGYAFSLIIVTVSTLFGANVIVKNLVISKREVISNGNK